MVIRRHHDLPAHGFNGIERVQEFFLRCLLAAEEMHVVDDEQIEIAHFSAEGVELVLAQRLDELIGEFLAGEIGPSLGRVKLNELLAQPLEQMRLAQPAIAVDEQRVVLRAGKF